VAGIAEEALHRKVLALFGGELAIRRGLVPDVNIEPNLMARMAVGHRAAAWHREIANEQAGPAVLLLRVGGEALDISDERGMAPIAVARKTHDLPGCAVHGQRLAAGEAAMGIKANGFRREIGGLLRRPEQILRYGFFRDGG
jgi:hypothetical protein